MFFFVCLFVLAVGFLRVLLEAQTGNTRTSVRLIVVGSSSPKFKPVIQLWVAKQCSSSSGQCLSYRTLARRGSGVSIPLSSAVWRAEEQG